PAANTCEPSAYRSRSATPWPAPGSPSGAPSTSRIGRPLSHSPTSSGGTSNVRCTGRSRTSTWYGVSLAIAKLGSRGTRSYVSSGADFRQDARVKTAGLLVLAIGLAGCGDNLDSSTSTGSIAFGSPGPLSGAAGRGSFRFGAATAATQIEDMNPHTD